MSMDHGGAACMEPRLKGPWGTACTEPCLKGPWGTTCIKAQSAWTMGAACMEPCLIAWSPEAGLSAWRHGVHGAMGAQSAWRHGGAGGMEPECIEAWER